MSVKREQWFILITLAIIWGSSFILIKKSLLYYNPYEVGALRVLIAGIFLMPLALKHYKKFPLKKWKWLVLAAFTGNFIPMFLFPIAETMINSSIAGIINSMMPISVIIIGFVFWKIKTSYKQMIGVAISFFGVCLLAFGNGIGSDIKILPVLLMLFAVSLYAVSVTTVKAKLQETKAVILSAFVFAFVLIVPSIISLYFAGFTKDFTLDSTHIKGLGYVSLLSVFGTGLAMMMYYRLLNISTPLFSSTVTLLMPIVAIIWGVLDGEKLTWIQGIGSCIIFSGLLFLRAKIPLIENKN